MPEQSLILRSVLRWGVSKRISEVLVRGKPIRPLSIPDITNQQPHRPDQNDAYQHTRENKYVYRIHQDKRAAGRVEAVKASDSRRQRKQIILRELKNMFARMILRSPWKGLAGRVHLDLKHVPNMWPRVNGRHRRAWPVTSQYAKSKRPAALA